jgi:DNA-directed RNA polymerase subunit RPC12/RpoP
MNDDWVTEAEAIGDIDCISCESECGNCGSTIGEKDYENGRCRWCGRKILDE